jgi:hypothetical protein
MGFPFRFQPVDEAIQALIVLGIKAHLCISPLTPYPLPATVARPIGLLHPPSAYPTRMPPHSERRCADPAAHADSPQESGFSRLMA